jgi:hypothetical protein
VVYSHDAAERDGAESLARSVDESRFDSQSTTPLVLGIVAVVLQVGVMLFTFGGAFVHANAGLAAVSGVAALLAGAVAWLNGSGLRRLTTMWGFREPKKCQIGRGLGRIATVLSAVEMTVVAAGIYLLSHIGP